MNWWNEAEQAGEMGGTPTTISLNSSCEEPPLVCSPFPRGRLHRETAIVHRLRAQGLLAYS